MIFQHKMFTFLMISWTFGRKESNKIHIFTQNHTNKCFIFHFLSEINVSFFQNKFAFFKTNYNFFKEMLQNLVKMSLFWSKTAHFGPFQSILATFSLKIEPKQPILRPILEDSGRSLRILGFLAYNKYKNPLYTCAAGFFLIGAQENK